MVRLSDLMLYPVLIDIGLLEWVLVPLSVRKVMCIVARILEGAKSLSLVEVPAWDVDQGITILVDQLLFELVLHDHAS